MSFEMPVLKCARRDFAELTADPAGEGWREVASVELSEATKGTPPQQRTWVRVGWSAVEWRILFECEDRDPWATLTERDAPLFQEETVEVFFDPIGDFEGYYEIETNPLGAMLDIVFRKSRSGYKGDWAWNCEGLRVAVKRTERGWNAELAVPFASVAEVPGVGSRWRGNFCRIDRPARDGSIPRELSAWSPPMRESFHAPERFGVIEFVS
jgi:hypothetical protein